MIENDDAKVIPMAFTGEGYVGIACTCRFREANKHYGHREHESGCPATVAAEQSRVVVGKVRKLTPTNKRTAVVGRSGRIQPQLKARAEWQCSGKCAVSAGYGRCTCAGLERPERICVHPDELFDTETFG